jgi:RNA polymerase sigma-70 factor, ECF subfamily
MTAGAHGEPDRDSGDALSRFAFALRGGDTQHAREHDVEARARLARFCYGYLGDNDAAEDAVQETLTRLISAAQPPDSPRAWLFRVARNVCLDRLRAGQTRPDRAQLASSFDVARETAGPVTRMIGAEGDAEVLAAMASLSGDERELLRLRYSDDLARAELAEVLGLSESLVKSRLYEAITKLRRSVGGEG